MILKVSNSSQSLNILSSCDMIKISKYVRHACVFHQYLTCDICKSCNEIGFTTSLLSICIWVQLNPGQCKSSACRLKSRKHMTFESVAVLDHFQAKHHVYNYPTIIQISIIFLHLHYIFSISHSSCIWISTIFFYIWIYIQYIYSASVTLTLIYYFFLFVCFFVFVSCKKIRKLSSKLAFVGGFPLRVNELFHNCFFPDIFERQKQ